MMRGIPSKVAVIGAGTMGHGIAEVVAIAGPLVSITDIEQRFLDSAKEKIKWSLSKMAAKSQLKEDPSSILSRIQFELDFEKAVRDSDLVIEAVPEKLDIKRETFRKLDAFAPSRAVLATNTSSLPISEISSSISDPSRVVGLHFFNPPPVMRLIEVIRGQRTSQDVIDFSIEFAGKLGKRPVLVNKDVPGFIVNRILVRMMVTARLAVEYGLAKMEEVDASLKYQAGLPMGAFELADYIGLDVVYFVENALAERGFQVTAQRMLKERVDTGRLGMKSGEGFYKYTKEKQRVDISQELSSRISASLLLSPAINEAVWIMSNDVASRDDIDLSVVLGLGFQKGILRMADEWGLDNVISNLKQLEAKTSQNWFRPESALLKMVSEGRTGVYNGIGFYEYPKQSC
jgi:enoyl-CoA hydratase/3-hydroxyacyl-CoA dehydrogenase